jgi:acyl-CoA dehydrogenase
MASGADDLQLLAGAVGDLLRKECPPEVVERAERDGWAPGVWAALHESGIAGIGRDGTLAEAMTAVRVAASFAAPVPLAETVLAHLLDPDAGEGPLAVAAGGRAAYGRIATRILGGPEFRLEPDTNLAGEPWDRVDPPGLDVMTPMGALVRSVQIAGALEAVLDMTVAYAGERVQFGQPIGRFQAVQQQLAVLAGEAMAAAAATDRAIAEPGAATIAAAKVRCAEAATAGTAIAHQIHGAIGVTAEHRLQHYTRRLWSWRDDFGSEAAWAIELGRIVAAQGADRFWDASRAEGSSV